MLLTLWLYAIGQGIGSGREIARLTTNDDAFRFIVGDLRPSHDVLARFRVDHRAAFDKLLTDVLAVLADADNPEISDAAHAARAAKARDTSGAKRFLRADVPRHVLRAASHLVGGFAECCYEPCFSSAFQPLPLSNNWPSWITRRFVMSRLPSAPLSSTPFQAACASGAPSA